MVLPMSRCGCEGENGGQIAKTITDSYWLLTNGQNHYCLLTIRANKNIYVLTTYNQASNFTLRNAKQGNFVKCL